MDLYLVIERNLLLRIAIRDNSSPPQIIRRLVNRSCRLS
jgi:hypothetical protein